MYHLKKCAYCAARKESAAEIYLQHVTAVARMAREMAAKEADRSVPLEAVIIWDDMLRQMASQAILSATRSVFLTSPSVAIFLSRVCRLGSPEARASNGLGIHDQLAACLARHVCLHCPPTCKQSKEVEVASNEAP